MKYCLGNGFELLSAPTVLAVCRDSNAVVAFVDYPSIIKVNLVIIFPRIMLAMFEPFV